MLYYIISFVGLLYNVSNSIKYLERIYKEQSQYHWKINSIIYKVIKQCVSTEAGDAGGCW